MKTMIVIPARYASSRFPGKPLSPIRGATGVAKSLIERTWRAAMAVQGVDRVVVATDDDRILEECRRIGANAMMTPTDCENGTERCAYVAKHFPEYDLFVNFQGDAPLTPPAFCHALIDAFSDEYVDVATPALRCSLEALGKLKADRAEGRVGGTTVVFDHDGDALYFSKEVIPYTAGEPDPSAEVPVFHHVGLYGYRRAALTRYASTIQGTLEAHEGLEQLRFLEGGQSIRCVQIESEEAFWELNNPTDTGIIETVLADRGVE
ncbi:3-deoxy-manno-octulosonate cytidylyltransferase family protein [Salipiger mucosus]|uniref:3-deoxy-manno-octulosonate cytidylyltransferase n=1 Tax=Salipiger mucosus DSM 16094 TaxID=1123237 RepID=S9QRD5_9RHOB|nr:manno-octulosonate cytidylyltransferase [Salipiger mucosus]EPX83961.1 3-deoxy-manno-octulosonate cytidylyltransferase [Salipiger mucosus DSM 16094]